MTYIQGQTKIRLCQVSKGVLRLTVHDSAKYSVKDYLDILVELVHITKTHPDLVSAIGLCNFDTEHTEEACKYLLEKTGAVGLVSNQVQVGYNSMLQGDLIDMLTQGLTVLAPRRSSSTENVCCL